MLADMTIDGSEKLWDLACSTNGVNECASIDRCQARHDCKIQN